MTVHEVTPPLMTPAFQGLKSVNGIPVVACLCQSAN